ncbi:MAG: GyrI-like domain-containing protein [Deltaproteobacteria bacterium]|nr:GyrI-like domain-containing protein [Deltaproteobacteria bacterium]
MLTSVELMDVPPQPILTVRVTATLEGLGAALGEALARVTNLALAAGAGAGAPVVRRLRRTPEQIEVLAGTCVPDPSRFAAGAEGEPRVERLPGGRVARALYTGAYRDLDKAHRELARWAREQGLEPAGPPWEIHTTGPTDVSDAASAKAQLYLPVRPAKAG